ncbi:MGMT family protein [Arthrobacter sp. VKM Ac-2550]|uniref:MGMT family protein n=1 Tax=Crystallibacter permensis TaxID=1938888 RepID=UPI002225B6DE|nr:MGMT family protein [Arthrobacter sp. VKM Ac-2550]
MRREFVNAVLEVAALIPAGRVLSYGDIAELLGSGGARQVGRVMSLHGAAVAWWRVIRADGTLPNELMGRAVRRYQRERTPLIIREAGPEPKVRMQLARWFPDDDDFDRIEDIRRKMSLPADGMEP